tara:strand:- start:86 stop:1429 length:1344 start_codon:yes stop_codon:yes gene_type:complete
MSNAIASQEKRVLEILPSNNAESYGSQGKQNVIKFEIADVPAVMLGESVRLNFEIDSYATASSKTRPTIDQDFNIDKCNGFQSIIQQVLLSSRRYSTGTNLESITSYSRLSSSMKSALFSPAQHLSNSSQQDGSVGKGMTCKDEPPTKVEILQVSDPTLQAQRKKLVKKTPVSLQLNSALLNSNLSLDQIGGLHLQIYLKENVGSVFWGADVNTGTSSYEISNVSLTVPVIYKSQEQIQMEKANPQPAISFLSWVNIYNVIQNEGSNSLNNRVSLKGLVSVIQNSLPVSHISNSEYNEDTLFSFGGIEEMSMSRMGVRSPREWTFNVKRERDTSSLNNIAENVNYSQIVDEYLSAYRNARDVYFSGLIGQNLRGFAGEHDGVMGCGTAYSPQSGAGIVNQGNITMNVITKAQDPDKTDLSSTQFGVHNFYLARSDLLINPSQGIQVA